jgi:quercetin dioxygenase-like cupin family protein/DNA-directed RNA polymerase subunit RPC12/RpoP
MEVSMKKMVSFFLLFSFLACPGFTQEKNNMNKIQAVKISDVQEFNADKFLKKNPLPTDKLVFNTYFFKPRQILPFHKHPGSDELFYIIDGTGEFTVGNDSSMVGPGSVVYGPADVFHGLVNSGNSNMVVITVQAPKPVEYVAAENSSLICAVCKQEIILKEGVKEGDIYICPRCGAKLKVTKKDGKWVGIPQ